MFILDTSEQRIYYEGSTHTSRVWRFSTCSTIQQDDEQEIGKWRKIRYAYHEKFETHTMVLKQLFDFWLYHLTWFIHKGWNNKHCFHIPIEPAGSLRTVILMWVAILSGGVIWMENPSNSLIGMHHRWIWMVERLREFGISVPWLILVYFWNLVVLLSVPQSVSLVWTISLSIYDILWETGPLKPKKIHGWMGNHGLMWEPDLQVKPLSLSGIWDLQSWLLDAEVCVLVIQTHMGLVFRCWYFSLGSWTPDKGGAFF